jgi:hypothetical protein
MRSRLVGDGDGRPMLHGPEPQPVLRDGKRRHHMPLGLPAIEERPHGDRPVTIEPRPYQFLRAGGPQPLLVRLNINVLIVIDLRRDKDALKPGQWIADDPLLTKSRKYGGKIDGRPTGPKHPKFASSNSRVPNGSRDRAAHGCRPEGKPLALGGASAARCRRAPSGSGDRRPSRHRYARPRPFAYRRLRRSAAIAPR